MNARRNEDQLPSIECNYNLIHSVEDISDESGSAGEPVTLQEVKDYLRLEGFNGDSSSGLSLQEPLNFMLTGFFVRDPLLQDDNVVITSVTRAGVAYTVVTTAPVGLQAQYDATSGEIIFELIGDGTQAVVVNYGVRGAAGTVDEFDFDDDLINSMIIEGRQYVEDITGIHLINKQLQVVFNCGAGMLEFPGPVVGDITLKDKNGNTQADSFFFGNSFKKLETQYNDKLIATYQAGYNQNAPEWAKGAIKAYVAWAYENRGDDKQARGETFPGSPERAAAICRPHRRLSAWG